MTSFSEIHVQLCCERTLAEIAFDLIDNQGVDSKENKEKMFDLLYMLSNNLSSTVEKYESIISSGFFR